MTGGQTVNRLVCALIVVLVPVLARAQAWTRHSIDNSSRGADGVRLADVNGDGLMDIATGWEEGGIIRVYLNPGPAKSKSKWPAVTVGEVKSPEDAVFADLDHDGAVDVVSSCEGRNRTVYVHWAPADVEKYLDSAAWTTEPIPCTQQRQMWMYALPLQIDGTGGIDLVVGSKGDGATVGWLQSPANPRDLAAWKFHPLYKAGWIMSLEAIDMDGDGDSDVVASDRKGKNTGVLWLENPGARAAGLGAAWKEHRIGADKLEVMFLTVVDLDRDGSMDVLTATRNSRLVYLRRAGKQPFQWDSYPIDNPFGVPNGKAVRVADIDLDGKLDIVHSTNTGGNRQWPGVAWMSYSDSVTDTRWAPHDISGSQGAKFDLIQLLDLDADGDLDVVTCEERDNLGLFWYENPNR